MSTRHYMEKDNKSSYENMEVERYRSFIGIITYIIGFFIVGTIITMIVARSLASSYGYDYKDVIEASTKISDDLNLRECAAKLTCYSNLLIYAVVFCALVIIMIISLKKDAIDFKSRLKRILVITAISVVAFNLGSILFDSIASKIASESSTNQTVIEEVFNHKSLAFLMVIETVILAPVVEELVFRKAIFNVLKNKPSWIPILVSAIAFSIIHMSATDLNWKWIVLYLPYLACGFMLAGIYKFSGENVYVTIIVHMVNNLIACILILL